MVPGHSNAHWFVHYVPGKQGNCYDRHSYYFEKRQALEMALIYDSFTITAAITKEMLGLTPLAEGHTLWSR